MTTAAVKDASVVLPVLLPRLPRIPGAATPPNQSGTFGYDLARELREILSAGGAGPGSLVAAHLDYLHQPRYPSMSQLGPAERGRVRSARISSIADQSIHWQYPATADEPLDVYRWKLDHLQRTVARTMEETGFLEPARRNRLVVFSDHGPRVGIGNDAFGKEQYYRTVLVTFGVPARDPARPISLLDIASLVGLPPPGRVEPTEPVVEYANVAGGDEWAALMMTARPLPDGRIVLDRGALARIGVRLLAFFPFAVSPGYARAPALPALEREVDLAGSGPPDLAAARAASRGAGSRTSQRPAPWMWSRDRREDRERSGDGQPGVRCPRARAGARDGSPGP